MASNIKYYVKNKDLLVELKKYKDTFKYDDVGKMIPNSGKMSDQLGIMIIRIANRISTKTKF